MDVFFDRLDQLFHAPETSTADSFPGDFTEPPFDQIQPRRTGRREMKVEPAVACQPALHAGMFVGGIVVDDQMQVAVRGRFAVHLP